jgi:hypothetical protein
MTLTEDLEVFMGDFAQPATIPQPSTTLSLAVIFDDEGVVMDIGVEGRSITATAKTSDLAGVKHGDSLITGGETYEIVGIVPIQDGKFTELQLKEN